MSSSVNKVILVGRVGRAPEVRAAGSGSVANFSLATDESYKDKNTQEKVVKTEWHRIVSWISVPFIEKYIHVGDMIWVEGKLQTREWTDKEGVKRTTTEINVLDIKPLSSKNDSSNSSSNRSSAKAAPAKRQEAEPEVSDEDIPF